MKISGIYLIKCVISGRSYVGSSIDCDNRWVSHRNRLRRGNHHSLRLQRAWDKYGEAAFIVEVAEVVPEGYDLFAAEQRWIDSHGNYNASPNARGRGAGFKNPHAGPSPEVRERIAESLRGRSSPQKGCKRSPETCAKIGLSKVGNKNRLGKVHTEETREKLAAVMHGKPADPDKLRKMHAALLTKGRTPEHCAAISAALKGRVITEEARAKTSATLRGRKLSPERVAAMADRWTPENRVAHGAKALGRTTSEETKRKQSEALRGRPKSPEARANMAAAQRARKAK